MISFEKRTRFRRQELFCSIEWVRLEMASLWAKLHCFGLLCRDTHSHITIKSNWSESKWIPEKSISLSTAKTVHSKSGGLVTKSSFSSCFLELIGHFWFTNVIPPWYILAIQSLCWPRSSAWSRSFKRCGWASDSRLLSCLPRVVAVRAVLSVTLQFARRTAVLFPSVAEVALPVSCFLHRGGSSVELVVWSVRDWGQGSTLCSWDEQKQCFER